MREIGAGFHSQHEKQSKLMNREMREMPGGLLPYTSVFIDAGMPEFTYALLQCVRCSHEREVLIQKLQKLWTTPTNTNHVLPLLSVRSGFDLYLRIMKFPPGSEVIMSAVNIPDMVHIVRHHQLQVVPLDISIDTTAPKVELLKDIVTPHTVAIVIAHLYGKMCPIDDIISFAKERNIQVIEDCAECFGGFEKLSHPETDLALFSFGVIKLHTSFGGSIAKIKDIDMYRKMLELHSTYRLQTRLAYMRKVLKYIVLYFCLDVPFVNKNGIRVFQTLGINHKDFAIKMLRGFPKNMLENIRMQPSDALLATMLRRQKLFSESDFCLQRLKGEYMAKRLPDSLDIVGIKAPVNNYWLFPVLAENPDNFVSLLNALGVEAYRGATQLTVVEPHNGDPEPFTPSPLDTTSVINSCTAYVPETNCGDDTSVSVKIPAVNKRYPHEAKYLIDHVVYLPINKLVPFHQLNCMLQAIRLAVNVDKVEVNGKLRVMLPSKL